MTQFQESPNNVHTTIPYKISQITKHTLLKFNPIQKKISMRHYNFIRSD